MKKLIASVLLSMVATTVTAATEQEYNFKEKINDWTFTQRSRENTWHFEAGHSVPFIWDNLDFTFRYADLDGTVEKRYKFTQVLGHYGPVVLSGRSEFRSFDNKEDHWRYRFIIDYKHAITSNADVWIKLQPRWAFKDAGTHLDARDQAGVDFNFDNIKFGLFVERSAANSWGNHSGTVIGTNFTLKM